MYICIYIEPNCSCFNDVVANKIYRTTSPLISSRSHNNSHRAAIIDTGNVITVKLNATSNQ